MDNKAIRKANVAWLVREHGGPTEFGKVLERDQVQVSQWLGGKSIGDRLARHIESQLGKPSGWLDAPQWNAGSADGVSASQAGRLDTARIVAAANLLAAFIERPGALVLSDPLDAELFAVTYAAVASFPAATDPAYPAALARLSKRLGELQNGRGDYRPPGISPPGKAGTRGRPGTAAVTGRRRP